MIYFQSRYLADKLGINLAKWKRWSREFLAPDPLGGLRSGYARQFSYRDAFVVYLGGYLVGALNFSIPQAHQILSDLNTWLKTEGYYALPGQMRRPDRVSSQIRIFYLSNGNFGFEIRIYSEKWIEQSGDKCTERYQRLLINLTRDDQRYQQATHTWVIGIDHLHQIFMDKLNT